MSPHVPSATHRTSNKTDLQVPALAEKAHWDVGTLQQYIAYVRSGAGAGINGESPRHSKAAENVIVSDHVLCYVRFAREGYGEGWMCLVC